MNSQDFDQLIDAAAEQLVGREPSSALTDAVMARVRARQGSEFGVLSSRFWFSGSRLWFSSGAPVAVLAIVFVLNFVLNTPPTPTHAPEFHASVPSQPAQPFIPSAVGPPVAVPIASRQTAKHLADRSRRSIVDERAVTTFLVDDPIVMEPIEADAIDPDPIEIAPIAVAVSQPPEQIQIEPLIVEPIASSND